MPVCRGTTKMRQRFLRLSHNEVNRAQMRGNAQKNRAYPHSGFRHGLYAGIGLPLSGDFFVFFHPVEQLINGVTACKRRFYLFHKRVGAFAFHDDCHRSARDAPNGFLYVLFIQKILILNIDKGSFLTLDKFNPVRYAAEIAVYFVPHCF